jgi:hypothetical protein
MLIVILSAMSVSEWSVRIFERPALNHIKSTRSGRHTIRSTRSGRHAIRQVRGIERSGGIEEGEKSQSQVGGFVKYFSLLFIAFSGAFAERLIGV